MAFVMQSVGLKLGPLWAVIISSLWFGLLHGLNTNFSWLALLNITLAGVFMACYALYEGGLWGVCAWHAAWNWAQGNLFGVEVSGIQLPVSLLDTAFVGSDLWTGGSFGARAAWPVHSF
ncbi:CPBP family intramembrane metalloprotease [Candidatus Gracilibacteria bacterium]|nr:CPBP family intramembrane metalloprotease [Candidatus Gracilibacteria bacterium]